VWLSCEVTTTALSLVLGRYVIPGRPGIRGADRAADKVRPGPRVRR